MGDLVSENKAVIVDLLRYSQWDYDLVGQALLSPVNGSELERWIKENVVNYPYPVQVTNSIPEHLGRRNAGRAGRWDWLRKMIVEEMAPFARENRNPKNPFVAARKMTLPNKKDMSAAQSAASTVNPERKECLRVSKFPSSEYKLKTRSEPVDGKDGKYYLHIEVTYERALDVIR